MSDAFDRLLAGGVAAGDPRAELHYGWSSNLGRLGYASCGARPLAPPS